MIRSRIAREKGPDSLRAFLAMKWMLGYSVQRLKTREPLVPPKPKEFDRA